MICLTLRVETSFTYISLRGETVLDFAHFVNGTWITDLVFVNLETQPSGPPLSPFHTAILPSRPAIYFYDTEGALVAPESVVDVTGDLEITEDGALTVQIEMEPLGVLTISTHGLRGVGALRCGWGRVVHRRGSGNGPRQPYLHHASGGAGPRDAGSGIDAGGSGNHWRQGKGDLRAISSGEAIVCSPRGA